MGLVVEHLQRDPTRVIGGLVWLICCRQPIARTKQILALANRSPFFRWGPPSMSAFYRPAHDKLTFTSQRLTSPLSVESASALTTTTDFLETGITFVLDARVHRKRESSKTTARVHLGRPAIDHFDLSGVEWFVFGYGQLMSNEGEYLKVSLRVLVI